MLLARHPGAAGAALCGQESEEAHLLHGQGEHAGARARVDVCPRRRAHRCTTSCCTRARRRSTTGTPRSPAWSSCRRSPTIS